MRKARCCCPVRQSLVWHGRIVSVTASVEPAFQQMDSSATAASNGYYKTLPPGPRSLLERRVPAQPSSASSVTLSSRAPWPHFFLGFPELGPISKEFIALCDEQHDAPRLGVGHAGGIGAHLRFQSAPESGIAFAVVWLGRHGAQIVPLPRQSLPEPQNVARAFLVPSDLGNRLAGPKSPVVTRKVVRALLSDPPCTCQKTSPCLLRFPPDPHPWDCFPLPPGPRCSPSPRPLLTFAGTGLIFKTETSLVSVSSALVFGPAHVHHKAAVTPRHSVGAHQPTDSKGFANLRARLCTATAPSKFLRQPRLAC
jgi:hypothetical protein